MLVIIKLRLKKIVVENPFTRLLKRRFYRVDT